MDIKKEVEINLTANDLAEQFISWGDDQQGEFINLIGKHFKESDFNAELQVCYMSNRINKDGKYFIYTLANFVKVQKFTDKSKHFDMLLNSYNSGGL